MSSVPSNVAAHATATSAPDHPVWFRAAIFRTEAPPAEIYISKYQESTGFYYHDVSVIFQPFVLMVNVSATVSWLAILR